MTFDLPQSELTLIDELERAAAMLRLIREHLAHFPTTTLEDYERVEKMPTYRALRRDERQFQALWLRLHARLMQLQKHESLSYDRERSAGLRELDLDLRERQLDIRQQRRATPVVAEASAPKPSHPRNAPCPCGSQLKYKRCCGHPLRQPLAA